MGSDLGCCAKVVKIVLVLINILFAVLGIVIFAIGIYAIVENQDYSFITENSVVSGAAILIVCGIITAIISIVGILGAIFQLRPLLVIYAGIVLIVVILEIVAGILAFVFQDELLAEVEDRSLDAIARYCVSPDSCSMEFREDINDVVEVIQSTFECCGYNNATDWAMYNDGAIEATGNRAPACLNCNAETDEGCGVFSNRLGTINYNTTTVGCREGFTDTITVIAYVVGGLGITIGILEIVGILFALFLCCCITSARKQEVV